MAARKMQSSIRVGKRVYTPDQADDLDKVLTEDQVTYLKGRKLISGSWTGQKAASTPKKKKETDDTGGESKTLPSGYPGRAVLMKGGFDTLDKVAAASDDELLALDGIGEETLKAIRGTE